LAAAGDGQGRIFFWASPQHSSSFLLIVFTNPTFLDFPFMRPLGSEHFSYHPDFPDPENSIFPPFGCYPFLQEPAKRFFSFLWRFFKYLPSPRLISRTHSRTTIPFAGDSQLFFPPPPPIDSQIFFCYFEPCSFLTIHPPLYLVFHVSPPSAPNVSTSRFPHHWVRKPPQFTPFPPPPPSLPQTIPSLVLPYSPFTAD